MSLQSLYDIEEAQKHYKKELKSIHSFEELKQGVVAGRGHPIVPCQAKNTFQEISFRNELPRGKPTRYQIRSYFLYEASFGELTHRD